MRKELMDYLFYLKENNLFHTPQSLEMQLCEAISTGNVPMLQGFLYDSIEGIFGVLSHDADRQARYMFVTAASVFARAIFHRFSSQWWVSPRWNSNRESKRTPENKRFFAMRKTAHKVSLQGSGCSMLQG